MSDTSSNNKDNNYETNVPLHIVYDQFNQRIISHHKTKEEAYNMLDQMGNEYKKIGSRQLPRYLVKEF